MEVENSISKEWSESTLGDLITHKKGFAFKSKDYSKHGRKIVKVKDFTSNSIDDTECDFISEELAESFSDYELKHKDVVIQTVGSWPSNPASIVGKVVRVPQKVEDALLNQNAVKLNSTKKVDNDFLFYSLIYNRFKSHLISRAQGSANQASITLKDIFDYELNLPPISEQKAIAKVLTTFDDKIELLQSQNKTLETMAQTIFKEWFGKYQKGDELPEGWRVDRLEDICEIQKGLSYKGKHLVEDGMPMVNLGSVKPGGGYRAEKIKYYNGDFKERHIAVPGDIIIANTDMTYDRIILGSPFMVTKSIGEKVLYTHHLFRVKSNEKLKWYVYYYIKSPIFREMAESCVTGTTVLALPKNDIVNFEVVIPLEQTLNKFNSLVQPLRLKIEQNNYQIQSLTKTRDTLLPKLMSGQVRVNNIKQTANA